MLSRIATATEKQQVRAKGRVHTGSLRADLKVAWDAPTSSVRVTSHGRFLAILRLLEPVAAVEKDGETEIEPKHIMVVLTAADGIENVSVGCIGRINFDAHDGYAHVRVDATDSDADEYAWLWLELAIPCGHTDVVAADAGAVEEISLLLPSA